MNVLACLNVLFVIERNQIMCVVIHFSTVVDCQKQQFSSSESQILRCVVISGFRDRYVTVQSILHVQVTSRRYFFLSSDGAESCSIKCKASEGIYQMKKHQKELFGGM